MAQFITTLSLGAARFHLCHTGSRVFSSPHYMTGGVIVAGVIYRKGRFCDAHQPTRILNEADICARLGAVRVTRFQAFARSCRLLADAWSLPFRRPTMRHWNPWLG